MMFSPASMPQRGLVCAAVFFLLSACAVAPVSPTGNGDAVALCERDGISINTDFASAGQHGCGVRDGEFVLTVWPEPSLEGRINPSPWYAFEVTGEPGDTVKVVLDYGSYRHRYAPWMQVGEREWQPFDEADVTLFEEEHKASFDITLGGRHVTIAGLPIVAGEEVADWLSHIEQEFGVQSISYGASLEGRQLDALVVGDDAAERLVVVLTRQHPPEVAGSLAFQGFVREVLSDFPDEVLADTRFLFFPLMNPDGVEHGYWRHNSGAVDLNRDWFEPSQPEIQAAQQLILDQARGREVFAFLDFHSTWRTLVYFHPFDTPGADASFPVALKDAMDVEFEPVPDWIFSHNDGKGTSKNWALQTFNVPGMTIELGDSVSEEDARRVGEVAAEVLLEQLQ